MKKNINLEKLDCDKVFVLHVKKGYEERRIHIENQMKLHDINFEYILDGDISDLNEVIFNNYFASNLHNYNHTPSITYKHILAYKKAVINNYKSILIFEDDAILDKNFNNIFNKSVLEFRLLKNSDHPTIISYENSELKYFSNKNLIKGKLLYPNTFSRCAAAYLVNQAAAKLFIEDAETNKVNAIIDWWHNQLIEKKQLKMLWCFPTIVEQGSHNGMFNSALDSKKRGIYFAIKFKIEKFYKKNVRVLFK
jgi:glycosyl transferase, family 25